MQQTISNGLKQILLAVFFLSLSAIVISFFFIDRDWEPTGILMGDAAIITLWIVAIPGILKRFRVGGILQQVQIILMASRRRLGILMFTFAFMHYIWNRLFVYIKEGFPDPAQIQLFERMGFLAFVLLLPLFLTSNNFSVRLLKNNWQRLQYLIYPAVWLVAFHTTLMGGRFLKFALPTYTIAILQLLSHVYKRR